MKMSHRQAAVVEEVPFGRVALDRVHPHAKKKMSRVVGPKIVALAPDGLPPFYRVVPGVKETNLTALLQEEEPDQCKRQPDGQCGKEPLSTKTDNHHRGPRDQKREL
jgi:hypothetical protein